MTDNKGIKILKENKTVVALNYNIRIEIDFKIKRAFIFNIIKIEEKANVLRKRSSKISSNFLLKETRNNII